MADQSRMRAWTGETLRRRSVVLMILLNIVTLGFYSSVWFLLRRRALNLLHEPGRIGLLECSAPLVLSVVGPMGEGFLDAVYGSTPGFAWLGAAVRLAASVLFIALNFRVMGLLEGYLQFTEAERPMFAAVSSGSGDLSRLLTFFFGCFYLQHVINTRVLPVREARAGDGTATPPDDETDSRSSESPIFLPT